MQAENVELKETVSEQSKQINQILEMLKGQQTSGPEPDITVPDDTLEAVIVANKKKYASLGVKTMAAWLKNNWEDYLGMPEEDRFEIETRYQVLYQTPFPEDKPASIPKEGMKWQTT